MRPRPGRHPGEGGQAVTELALALPLLMLLIFGVAELAQAHTITLTIGAAAREGARVAGALVNGGGALGCAGGQSPNAASVDPQIIAAIERVLTASGTTVTVADVNEIRVYKANSSGGEVSTEVNRFTYAPNGGPVVDGERIDFVVQGDNWRACERKNLIPADSAGVTIRYTYRLFTPLRGARPTLSIRDTAVMSLNASR